MPDGGRARNIPVAVTGGGACILYRWRIRAALGAWSCCARLLTTKYFSSLAHWIRSRCIALQLEVGLGDKSSPPATVQKSPFATLAETDAPIHSALHTAQWGVKVIGRGILEPW